MAKVIKYKFLSCWVNYGTEENPKYEPAFLEKELFCNTEADFEINLTIAQKEAYNGEYTIEGEFDDIPEPTLENRVETLETDGAEMKEALEMILSGVTE